MPTIQWRPEVTVLTVPPSYKIRFVPRDSSGKDDLAVAMSEENLNMAEYASLLDLVRDQQYYGRLVDVLDVRVGA